MELRRSYAHGFMALTVLLLVAGGPGSRCWSRPCNLRAGLHVGKCHGSVALMDLFPSGGLTSEPGYDCGLQRVDKALPSMAVIGRPAISLDRETRDCGLSVETFAPSKFSGFGRHLVSTISFSPGGKDLVLHKCAFLS